MYLEIPWWAVHLYGLLLSLPGIILSVLLLWKLPGSRTSRITWTGTWIVGMAVVVPWLAVIGTDWITPNIHARFHAYESGELLLRVWGPASAIPLIISLVVRGFIELLNRE